MFSHKNGLIMSVLIFLFEKSSENGSVRMIMTKMDPKCGYMVVIMI